jgi:hypothetical protein
MPLYQRFTGSPARAPRPTWERTRIMGGPSGAWCTPRLTPGHAHRLVSGSPAPKRGPKSQGAAAPPGRRSREHPRGFEDLPNGAGLLARRQQLRYMRLVPLSGLGPPFLVCAGLGAGQHV